MSVSQGVVRDVAHPAALAPRQAGSDHLNHNFMIVADFQEISLRALLWHAQCVSRFQIRIVE